jgi:hypothetical protein
MRGRDKDDSDEGADQHEGEGEGITLEERQSLLKVKHPPKSWKVVRTADAAARVSGLSDSVPGEPIAIVAEGTAPTLGAQYATQMKLERWGV